MRKNIYWLPNLFFFVSDFRNKFVYTNPSNLILCTAVNYASSIFLDEEGDEEDDASSQHWILHALSS